MNDSILTTAVGSVFVFCTAAALVSSALVSLSGTGLLLSLLLAGVITVAVVYSLFSVVCPPLTRRTMVETFLRESD